MLDFPRLMTPEGDSGRVVFATPHQLHDCDVTMTNGWVMGMGHDILPHCLLSLLLIGGLEHEFYDFPYIGNNNPN